MADRRPKTRPYPSSQSISKQNTYAENYGSNNKNSANSPSVNFNGSSFSGVDVQLMIHSSHPEVVSLYQNDLLNQIQAAAEKRNTIEYELDSLGIRLRDYASSSDGTIPGYSVPLLPRIKDRTRYEYLIPQLEALDAEIELLQSKHEQASYMDTALIPLATVQTLSVQTHAEKSLVRSLGFKQAKGVTRGPRTIAGTMILAFFTEHALTPFFHQPPTQWNHEFSTKTYPILSLPDQLPPLTVTAVFANEYGSVSQMNLYGVEFINDGITMSIEDLYTENVMTYIARDYDPPLMIEKKKALSGGAAIGLSGNPFFDEPASKLLRSPEYKEYKKRFDIRRNRNR